MNRRTRARIALASIAPCVVAIVAFCLLAATGTVSWGVLPALLIALAVLAAITYVRMRPRIIDGR